MDGCDAEDQSRWVSYRRNRRSVRSRRRRRDRSPTSSWSVRSRRHRDQSPTSSCDTTLGMIKGSHPRKRRTIHQEEEDEEEAHVAKMLVDAVPIPDEAANVTQGEGEAGMFHPRIYEGIVYGPSFMFEKVLWSSDVSADKNRLLVTGGYYGIVMLPLKGEEQREVYDESLRLVTTDKNGVEYTLVLKWVRRGAIAFIGDWSKLVEANGLKKGDYIEVYGYRVGPGEELRLAIHVIPKNELVS